MSSLLDLTNILKDYSLGATAKDMRYMYKTATADRQNFFLLDVDGEPDKRYRMNFDKYFLIPDSDDEEDEDTITLNELS